MKHENLDKKIIVEETDINFESIYGQSWFPIELGDQIKKANFLIIPDKFERFDNAMLFTETTSEFYDFLKLNQSGNVVVDIATDDDNFKKLELHSAVINVATVLVEFVILPFAINMIAAFLYDKIKSYRRKAEETQAHVNIIVETEKTKKTEKKSVKIEYEGPVSEVKESLTEAIDKIIDNNND